MLTVACCFWRSYECIRLPVFSHGVYTPDWVDRLCRAVRRNLSQPCRFICVTNDPAASFQEDVEVGRFVYSPQDWVSLIEMFRPEWCDERIVGFDLDTIITGSLDDLASFGGEIGMVLDPNHREWFTSGITSISAPLVAQLWDTYSCDPSWWRQPRRKFGPAGQPSQLYVLREMFGPKIQDLHTLYPGQIMSYKCEYRKSDAVSVDDLRMVYFHGRHKPHDIRDQALLAHWV
jgi:hypothetical protein